jgi:Tol biopolymer transport system component
LYHRVSMHVGVFTLLLLCSLTSGCQTEEHFFDVTGELAVLSAVEHYDEAVQRARSWRSDVYLSSILALPYPSDESDLEPLLLFQFDSASIGHSFYSVQFNGEAWSSRVMEQSLSEVRFPPIDRDDWSLDSVDAWNIALAHGGEDFLLDYRDPMTVISVELDYWRAGMGQGGLAWRVDFLILDGPSLDIFIDPKTGDIIEAEERSMSGTLVAATPTRPATPWAPLPACTPATPEALLSTGLPERIAFESSPDGTTQIYLMDRDGSNIEQLTEGPDRDTDAAWSPDGRRIAFTGWRGTNLDIYVMDADGANLERLTDHPGYDREPTWSPDGSRIAFSSDRDGNYNLYIMDADGANVAQLTDHPLTDDRPDWSPDGCHIAFSSDRGHTPVFHIYVIDVDGSDVEQLTDGQSTDYRPRWSPDGGKISFWSSPVTGVEGGPDIYVIDQDGSNRVRLTSGPCEDAGLVLHPGLTRIALWRLPSRKGQGAQDTQATSHALRGRAPVASGPCQGAYPVWSPDGTQILFAMGRDDPSGSDIFVMDSDGSNVIQLTDEPGYNIPCSWRK